MALRDPLGRIGASLMSVGFASTVGYLFASRAGAPSPTPKPGPADWPYALCAGMFPIGLALYLVASWRRRSPIRVELLPEQDGDRLRLVLVNKGIRAEFTVNVVSFTDEEGEFGPHGAWLIGGAGDSNQRQTWPVPWDEDGSTGSKEVLKGEPRVLRLATFNRAHTEQEVTSSHWGDGPHWLFASATEPVPITYWPVDTLAKLQALRFIVTVQVTSRQHDKPVMKTFSVGFGDWKLVCEPAHPPTPAPGVVTGPLYVKASPPQWREIGDDVYLIVLAVVICNVTDGKPIKATRAWLCAEQNEMGFVPPTTRSKLDRELEAVDTYGGPRLALGTIQPHECIGGTYTKEMRIAPGDPKPRCTFVVMDNARNTYTAPVADQADHD
jgi:hypothetical protein